MRLLKVLEVAPERREEEVLAQVHGLLLLNVPAEVALERIKDADELIAVFRSKDAAIMDWKARAEDAQAEVTRLLEGLEAPRPVELEEIRKLKEDNYVQFNDLKRWEQKLAEADRRWHDHVGEVGQLRGLIDRQDDEIEEHKAHRLDLARKVKRLQAALRRAR